MIDALYYGGSVQVLRDEIALESVDLIREVWRQG